LSPPLAFQRRPHVFRHTIASVARSSCYWQHPEATAVCLLKPALPSFSSFPSSASPPMSSARQANSPSLFHRHPLHLTASFACSLRFSPRCSRHLLLQESAALAVPAVVSPPWPPWHLVVASCHRRLLLSPFLCFSLTLMLWCLPEDRLNDSSTGCAGARPRHRFTAAAASHAGSRVYPSSASTGWLFVLW
jgi:hypothetical protein